MNVIRKEVITSLPVSLAYLFSITAAYAQTVQAFTLPKPRVDRKRLTGRDQQEETKQE